MINNFSGKYGFLSNYYAAPINYDGILYPTTEHAFQAIKSLNFEERKMIADCSTPGNAKKMGRTITLRKDWEDIKYGIMWQICLLKFLTWTDLKDKLLETGEEELVEGNTWNDKVWGVCDGQGTNWLGKILMDIRSRLK